MKGGKGGGGGRKGKEGRWGGGGEGEEGCIYVPPSSSISIHTYLPLPRQWRPTCKQRMHTLEALENPAVLLSAHMYRKTWRLHQKRETWNFVNLHCSGYCIHTCRGRACCCWYYPGIDPVEATCHPEPLAALEACLDGVQWEENHIDCCPCYTTWLCVCVCTFTYVHMLFAYVFVVAFLNEENVRMYISQ